MVADFTPSGVRWLAGGVCVGDSWCAYQVKLKGLDRSKSV